MFYACLENLMMGIKIHYCINVGLLTISPFLLMLAFISFEDEGRYYYALKGRNLE